MDIYKQPAQHTRRYGKWAASSAPMEIERAVGGSGIMLRVTGIRGAEQAGVTYRYRVHLDDKEVARIVELALVDALTPERTEAIGRGVAALLQKALRPKATRAKKRT